MILVDTSACIELLRDTGSPIEIENPGLLPFGLTFDDLPRSVSKLRNRVLGRTFKELGLVEQWKVREIGSGPNDPQRRYFRAEDRSASAADTAVRQQLRPVGLRCSHGAEPVESWTDRS